MILAKRTSDFLVSNKYVDPTIQKGFLPGISGCTDHNLVMDEVIKHAKHKKKTVHITFFDLEDAFGSVPHELIFHTLERNNFPQSLQLYFQKLYSNARSKVVSPGFQTNVFSFKRGVFQGDPMSPIIFILTFNPIIQFIQNQNSIGYKLTHKLNSINGEVSEEKIITLPYADDFCIITTDLRKHQKIIHTVDNYTQSMGMKLKPSKCRSFSVQSGKPSIVNFKIGENLIPSIFHEEQKFLGKLLFFSGKSSETFNYMKNELKTRLDRINETEIRQEYKLWIYKHYTLPSIRFLLTVHDITKTDLQKLDNFCHKYMKKWAGIPPCATNSVFHLKNALDIPSVTSVYDEAHYVAHTDARLKSDGSVNHAIDSKIDRESDYTRKQSITVTSENIFKKSLNENTVEGEIPNN